MCGCCAGGVVANVCDKLILLRSGEGLPFRNWCHTTNEHFWLQTHFLPGVCYLSYGVEVRFYISCCGW